MIQKTIQQIQLEEYELYRIKKANIVASDAEAMKIKYGIIGTQEEQEEIIEEKIQDVAIEKETLLDNKGKK